MSRRPDPEQPFEPNPKSRRAKLYNAGKLKHASGTSPTSHKKHRRRKRRRA